MRSASRALAAAAAAAALACGGGHSSSSGAPPLTIPAPADNVLTVSVNGSLCSRSYLNKPCVEVTVCAPGTTTCQKIPDVLLDTGSFGLRVFKQALGSVSLTPVSLGGTASLATCVQYADGAADWGPVAKAQVVLGNEPALEIPIHVMDAAFASVPTGCGTPEQGPSDAGFNGVLGVGVFAEDCGPGCETASDNGIYYSCDTSSGSCTGVTVAVADQIKNPVASLPGDANGVMVVLPSVSTGGAPSAEGALVLGLGTRSNNAVSGVGVYPVDGSGNLSTTFSGQTYGGFLDTGSNGLFFPAPADGSLPSCATAPSFFCPAVQPPGAVSLSASNSPAGSTGGPSVGFQIGNFEALLKTPNGVFPDIGGNALPKEGFDWGLPFHLGRRVVVGFDGRQSSLGTGPYVAY